MTKYRRIGGGQRFQLSPRQFSSKFTPLTEAQALLIEKYRIELETFPHIANEDEELEVNVSLLEKIVQINDEERGEFWEQYCDHGPGELKRPAIDFSRVVYDDRVETDVKAIVASILKRDAIDEEFGLKELFPTRRSVYGLYGPYGTGKTITALAITKALGKLIYQVDYTEINSASDRKKIFKYARKFNAVLFLDEADSLCAAREWWPSATAQRLNVDKNVFITELDKYDGPVIMATNLLNHFDGALMRRTSRFVELKLPDRVMLKKIYELHIPTSDRIQVDLDEVVQRSDGLSGGDVQNVVFNSIDSACVFAEREDWEVTTSHLLHEINRIRKAKADNLVDRRDRPHAQRSADREEAVA